MHQIKEYSGTPEQKQAQALVDIKQWVGEKRFATIVTELKDYSEANGILSPAYFALLLSFTGISGYPVEALYKHIWPNAEWNWDFLQSDEEG